MAEAVLRFAPGNGVTFTATTAVTGGQLVEVSGDRSVALATGSAPVVGQAAYDALAGSMVTVIGVGMVLTAVPTGVVVAGDRLKVGPDGTVAKHVAGTDPDSAAIGLALTGSAAGDVIEFVKE